MVKLEAILVNNLDFVGITLYVSYDPIYLIVSPKVLFVSEAFSLPFFKEKNPTMCLLQGGYETGFQKMLNTKIVNCNQFARECGVREGMLSKEAMILCEKNKD